MSRDADGDQWAGLLEESEQAIGEPEGGGWLDPHFYSVRALEAIGHEHAARACKAILASCLKDHEAWTGAVLRDGTPGASRATREWIEGEFGAPDRPPAPEFDGRIGPVEPTVVAPAADGPGSADGPAAEPDAWDEARELSRSGRLNEAFAVMVRAVRQARTGRERFLRTLQQAELCLASDRPALALPLLEMLAHRIDDMRLEQWEDGSICARVLSHLYRCLKGKDDARATAIYNRLCQIDAGEALLLSTT
jgi:type VI secretion system protein ImpA